MFLELQSPGETRPFWGNGLWSRLVTLEVETTYEQSNRLELGTCLIRWHLGIKLDFAVVLHKHTSDFWLSRPRSKHLRSKCV